MLVNKVLGLYFAFWGLIFLIKPQFLSYKLRKKGKRKIFLFVLALFFSILPLVAKAIWWLRVGGWFKVLLFFVVVVVTVRLLIRVKKGAYGVVEEFLSSMPKVFFRVWACFLLLLGWYFLTLR